MSKRGRSNGVGMRSMQVGTAAATTVTTTFASALSTSNSDVPTAAAAVADSSERGSSSIVARNGATKAGSGGMSGGNSPRRAPPSVVWSPPSTPSSTKAAPYVARNSAASVLLTSTTAPPAIAISKTSNLRNTIKPTANGSKPSNKRKQQPPKPLQLPSPPRKQDNTHQWSDTSPQPAQHQFIDLSESPPVLHTKDTSAPSAPDIPMVNSNNSTKEKLKLEPTTQTSQQQQSVLAQPPQPGAVLAAEASFSLQSTSTTSNTGTGAAPAPVTSASNKATSSPPSAESPSKRRSSRSRTNPSRYCETNWHGIPQLSTRKTNNPKKAYTITTTNVHTNNRVAAGATQALPAYAQQQLLWEGHDTGTDSDAVAVIVNPSAKAEVKAFPAMDARHHRPNIGAGGSTSYSRAPQYQRVRNLEKRINTITTQARKTAPRRVGRRNDTSYEDDEYDGWRNYPHVDDEDAGDYDWGGGAPKRQMTSDEDVSSDNKQAEDDASYWNVNDSDEDSSVHHDWKEDDRPRSSRRACKDRKRKHSQIQFATEEEEAVGGDKKCETMELSSLDDKDDTSSLASMASDPSTCRRRGNRARQTHHVRTRARLASSTTTLPQSWNGESSTFESCGVNENGSSNGEIILSAEGYPLLQTSPERVVPTSPLHRQRLKDYRGNSAENPILPQEHGDRPWKTTFVSSGTEDLGGGTRWGSPNRRSAQQESSVNTNRRLSHSRNEAAVVGCDSGHRDSESDSDDEMMISMLVRKYHAKQQRKLATGGTKATRKKSKLRQGTKKRSSGQAKTLNNAASSRQGGLASLAGVAGLGAAAYLSKDNNHNDFTSSVPVAASSDVNPASFLTMQWGQCGPAQGEDVSQMVPVKHYAEVKKQQRATLRANSLSHGACELLHTAAARARELYPNSKWILLWREEIYQEEIFEKKTKPKPKPKGSAANNSKAHVKESLPSQKGRGSTAALTRSPTNKKSDGATMDEEDTEMPGKSPSFHYNHLAEEVYDYWYPRAFGMSRTRNLGCFRNHRLQHLSDILESGELRGCHLRVSKGHVSGTRKSGDAMASYALVASEDLPPRTIVAVDTGILWSHHKHWAALQRQSKTSASRPWDHLRSTDICARLLDPFLQPNDWQKYLNSPSQKKLRSGEGSDSDEASSEDEIIDDIPNVTGFVMCSRTHGNETREIRDPAWSYCHQGSQHPEPNLETVAVLNVHTTILTVAYCTTTKVVAGQELTMDHGCSNQISARLVPRQAMISNAVYQEYQAMLDLAESRGLDRKGIETLVKSKQDKVSLIDGDKSMNEKNENSETETSRFLNGIYHEEKGISNPEVFGEKYAILFKIWKNLGEIDISQSDLLQEPLEEWGVRATVQPDLSLAVTRIAVPDLLPPVLQALQRIPNREDDVRQDRRVSNLVDNRFPLHARVEKVEITDPSHPAWLFCLPGESAYGVRARRRFEEGEPLLCYGGTLVEYSQNRPDSGAYWFDVHLPWLEKHTGYQLGIDGSQSMGGLVNDAWAPPGLPQREPNCTAETEWDKVKKVPQIIFRATTVIEKGEEILYSYGEKYWDVMFRNIAIKHVAFAQNQLQQCQILREYLQEKLSMTSKEIDRLLWFSKESFNG